MSKILPAILVKDKKDLTESLNLFDGIVDELQIDVLDGKLVPKISWPYTVGANAISELNSLLYDYTFNVELHLMLEENLSFIESVDSGKISRAVMQIESRDFEIAAKAAKNKGFLVGASAMLETSLESLESVLDIIDYVQFMCIEKIGVQGSKFNSKVIDKIKVFRQKHPQVELAVDGGVKKEHLPSLESLGVKRFAMGSAIMSSQNPVATWRELSELLTQ